MKFAIIQVSPFLNNPKNIDPSYKTDLDFWPCSGRKTEKYGTLTVLTVLLKHCVPLGRKCLQHLIREINASVQGLSFLKLYHFPLSRTSNFLKNARAINF